MILKQAKQNGIDVIIIIMVILAITLPSMFLAQTRQYILPPENGTPLFNTIYNFLFEDGISVWTQLLSLLLLTAELSVLVLLNSDFELTRAKPTLFAVVFLLSALSYIPCNTLLPEQIANIAIALGLIKLFACHSMDNARYTFFDAGLFFGIAVLFCSPAVIMLPVGLIMIAIFRPINGSELLIFILGFFTPVFFYTAGYYLAEGTLQPLQDYALQVIDTTREHTIDDNSIICLIVDAVQLLIASILILGEYPKYNLFHNRAYKVLLIMFLANCSIYFFPYFSLQAMRMTALPITILFVTVFYESRQSLWLEIFFGLFVLANLSLHILWYRL